MHAVMTFHGARALWHSFHEHLARGLAWSTVSTLALQGAVLVSNVLLARAMETADFGHFAVILATVMTMAGVAQGGLGLTAARFIGESVLRNPQAASQALRACTRLAGGLGFLTSLLLALAAPAIATHALGKPELATDLRWASLGVFFLVWNSVQVGALQGFGAFDLLGRSSLWAALAQVLLPALGAVNGGVRGALIGMVIASALRALAFQRSLLLARRRSLGPSLATAGGPIDGWRPLLRFALPASLASLVTLPALWWVTVQVARQPEGAVWAALLAAAMQLRLVAVQLPVILNTVTFSSLSRLRGKGDEKGRRNVFLSSALAGGAVAGLGLLVLAMFGKAALGLFGPAYGDAQPLLMWLLAATFVEYCAGTIYQLIQSAGMMWRSLVFIAIPRDLAYAVGASLLLPVVGLSGAGIALLVAQVLSLACTFTLAWVSGALPQLFKVRAA
jgi:O-antigen/teichoic acid export membrane protein